MKIGFFQSSKIEIVGRIMFMQMLLYPRLEMRRDSLELICISGCCTLIRTNYS